MTKPTFEQCLDYIETELGYQLLDWHKELLYKLYNDEKYYTMLCRYNGRTIYLKAKKILDELLNKENNNEQIKNQ